MTNEIVKRDAPTPIDTLRTLMTLDGDDALSIAKTALKDGSKGLIARGLSVLQRWNEDRFCGALLSEIEEMRSAGKIREDFNRTDAGVSSLREFFELIDGKPDAERFHAFCALFMSANAPDANSNEAILDLELMSILRSLSAAEMHLLSAFLKVRRYQVSGTSLMNLLSKELGFKSDALVFKNVTALIENNLIEKGNWTNQGGTPGQEKSLLTDLGVALLERIIRFDAFKEAQK
jgi:hypothetical protein